MASRSLLTFLICAEALAQYIPPSGGGGSNCGNPDCTISGNLNVQGTAIVGASLPSGAPNGTMGAGILYSPNAPINARAFGATGNGTTDDTTALAAAIAAGIAANSEVYIPAGTYKITSGFTIATPVTIRGAGAGQTIIKYSATSGNVFTVTYSTPGFALGASAIPVSATISDFQVNQAAGVTPTSGCLFSVANGGGANHYLTGLRIERIQANNLYAGVCLGSNVISNWFKDLYFVKFAGGNGIYVNSPSPSGDIHFDDIELTGANTGVTIDNTDTTQFVNLKTNGTGITINSPSFGVRFINPSIEGPNDGTGCGVTVASGVGSQNSEITQIIGGGIGLWADSFCGTFASGEVSVIGTNLYSTSNTTPPAYLALAQAVVGEKSTNALRLAGVSGFEAVGARALMSLVNNVNGNNAGYIVHTLDGSGGTHNAGLYYNPSATAANSCWCISADDTTCPLKVCQDGSIVGTVSGTITNFTTTGTSGPATFSGGTLNIPQYTSSGGGSGGIIASQFVNTNETTNSGTFVDLATVQQTGTFTLASDTTVDVMFTATTGNNAIVADNFCAINIDGSVVALNNQVVTIGATAFAYQLACGYTASLAAGDHNIKIQFKTDNGTANFQSRHLIVFGH